MNLNYRVVSKDAENIRNTAGCKSSFFILFHRKNTMGHYAVIFTKTKLMKIAPLLRAKDFPKEISSWGKNAGPMIGPPHN